MCVNRLQLLAATVLAVTTIQAGAASASTSPQGVWIDHTGRGGVEIKECGDGKLCGHVVWIKDENDARGCGLQILGNVKPIGGGQWDNGWIYSPEKKQKFSVELTPLDSNRLRVKGYKGIKLFSKTMIWHRASSSLQRCQTTTVKNAPKKPTTVGATAGEQNSSKETETAIAPRVLNSSPAGDTPKSEPEEQHAAVKPAPAPQPRETPNAADDAQQAPGGQDSQIYAADPPPQADGDTQVEQQRDGDDIDGLASLLEKFTKDDGVEVGDGYGMKVEKGPDGEKNCRLNVPFVTVRFPCED